MKADVIDVLLNTYSESGIEDTEENYCAYVQAFAAENSMKIYGKKIGKNNAWSTEGFDFNSKEDELVFVLKYGRIEIT